MNTIRQNLRSFLGVIAIVFVAILFQNCAPHSSPNEMTKSCVDGACEDNPTPSSSCEFDGQILENGQSTVAFLESVAESCTQENRICTNGVLSGNYEYASCSQNINTPKSCRFNGKTLAHGASVEAYLASTVQSGSSCSSQVRRCDDGVLSGSYQYASCNVAMPEACLFNGKTVAHGSNVRAFLHSSSPNGQNLCQSSQLRVCNNGSLSGSYTYSSCTTAQPRSCTSIDGRTLPHGASVRAYRNSTAAFGTNGCATSEMRTCNDGSLSGSFLHPSCEVDAPATCRFNGTTVPHGGSVRAYLNSSATHANASRCTQFESRACRNGVLSGSYAFASCQVNAPRSCQFDGKTIAHGATVVGYTSSTGVRGQSGACAATTKTCTDGTLSHPNAQFGSCTLTSPRACLFRGQTIPHGDSVYAYKKSSNGGVGRCAEEGEYRYCTDGTLSGTATFASCTTTCRYGRFNLNENQTILIGTHHGIHCTTPTSCRTYNSRHVGPINTPNGFVDTCLMNAVKCSMSAGNGEVERVLYTLLHRNNNACGNPQMSTPILRTSLIDVDGRPVMGWMTRERNIAPNGSLLWKAPHPYRGPLP